MGSEFDPQNPYSAGCSDVDFNFNAGLVRVESPWSSLASQPSLIGDFQDKLEPV